MYYGKKMTVNEYYTASKQVKYDSMGRHDMFAIIRESEKYNFGRQLPQKNRQTYLQTIKPLWSKRTSTWQSALPVR